MPKINKLPLPQPEWCNLQQALVWIAFDEIPYPDVYQQIIYDQADFKSRLQDKDQARKIQNAQKALLIYLLQSRLQGQGRYSDCCLTPEHSWELRKYKNHASHWTAIDANLWTAKGISMTQQNLRFDGGEYIDLRFCTKDVLYNFPPQNNAIPVLANQNDYLSPYMKIMLQAIQILDLRHNQQSKKNVLVDWFMTQEVNGQKLTRNMSKMMATLVRLPEAQRGGNSKWKKSA